MKLQKENTKMNTQTKTAMNRSTASFYFTGLPICFQELPIAFVPDLDTQAGMSEAIHDESRSRFKLGMKRIGMAGFIFFLVKGLIWLAVFTFGAGAMRNLFY